jgi:hypothetical protein
MNRRGFLQLGSAVLAGLALPRKGWADCLPFPPDGETAFTVIRNGSKIGHHIIRFDRREGRFVVRTDIAIEVSLLGATLYRYEHRAEETWDAGWLHALVSDTDDDGRLYRLRAERREGIFGGLVNGQRFTVSGYIIPSSLWHRDTPLSEALLDTVDGLLKISRGRLLGQEEVPVRGRAVGAKHYALQGQIERELWYDLDCNLVRVAMLGRDGSQITLELL